MFAARPARETRLKYCETGSRSKRKSGEPAKSLVRRIARESQRPCLTEFPGRCRQRLRDFSLRARLRESVLTGRTDRKSTRLNSSHGYISYAVFCLKKKKKRKHNLLTTSQYAPQSAISAS